jgi:ABC-type Na+ transport system ATPase subunit NatA
MPSQQSQTPALDLYKSFEARRQSAKTLLGFSLIYLTDYFGDPPALFHPELVNALESDDERRLLIIGFRGSGKSTFGSLALPLWAALEHPEKYPFIILIADSSRQATLNISAIKTSLKRTTSSSRTTARSKGMSSRTSPSRAKARNGRSKTSSSRTASEFLRGRRGQKVRGLRHLQHRPKLVVVDDPEDGEWVTDKGEQG